VRRPQALRRLRAAASDRRTAVFAFLVAAIVVLATAGIARSIAPAGELPDPYAANDLVALMAAGERGSWSVNYDFTRTLADGRVLNESMQEARNPSLHLLLSGTSMTVDTPKRSYDCNLVEGRWPCTGSTAGAVLPPSEVLRVALAHGWYVVTRAPGSVIAGEQAECFRVLATGDGQLPDIGTETDRCLAADGVALSERVVHSTGDVDARVARSVLRGVSTAAIETLAHGFDPKTAGGGP
jgi:hypothetical protein